MIRGDFYTLEDGDWVILHPRPSNPRHHKPIRALFSGGAFYCQRSPSAEDEEADYLEPDYYIGNVLTHNIGFTKP